MLGMSYRELKTNECVWQQVNILAGLQEILLSTVRRRKLSWFGHECRHGMLSKIILQGTVAEEDLVNHGRTISRNGWKAQSMSSLLRIADDRGRRAVIAADASFGVP